MISTDSESRSRATRLSVRWGTVACRFRLHDVVMWAVSAAIIGGIRDRVRAGRIRITQHAAVEMVADAISLDDLLHAIESENAQIVEDYPQHKRGACCLLAGLEPLVAPSTSSVHPRTRRLSSSPFTSRRLPNGRRRLHEDHDG